MRQNNKGLNLVINLDDFKSFKYNTYFFIESYLKGLISNARKLYSKEISGLKM